jgi:hypothetical protein
MAAAPNTSAANLMAVLIFMAYPWLDSFFLPDPGVTLRAITGAPISTPGEVFAAYLVLVRTGLDGQLAHPDHPGEPQA